MRTRQGRPYNNIFNCMAFPVGVNRNNVAAHYSPRDWEDEWLDLKKDSVSIDFGLMDPSLGVLTDGAFTWNGEENHIGKQLSVIAEGAVDEIIKHAGSDAVLGELGHACQEYVSSQEVVIEGKEERKSVSVLKDLCGHKIGPYVIHAGKAVPSISLPQYTVRMQTGETYAVEVFPTVGDGQSVEVDVEEDVPTHLSLNGDIIQRMKTAPRDYMAKLISIVTTRKCVPFHPDWYNLEDTVVKGGIKDEFWKAYPTIKTRDQSLVVQWEKMIRVMDSGTKLLLKA